MRKLITAAGYIDMEKLLSDLCDHLFENIYGRGFYNFGGYLQYEVRMIIDKFLNDRYLRGWKSDIDCIDCIKQINEFKRSGKIYLFIKLEPDDLTKNLNPDYHVAIESDWDKSTKLSMWMDID